MIVKTTCPEHRRVGYSLTWRMGVSTWICKACGLGQERHETTDETIARLRAEGAVK
jgi:hypothetical protein